jgi:hypothetical protein
MKLLQQKVPYYELHTTSLSDMPSLQEYKAAGQARFDTRAEAIITNSLRN